MHVQASLQPARRHGVGRVFHNVARLPQRTYASVKRLIDPSYALERQARSVASWFNDDELARLESISGMCSHRECRLLAFLTSRAAAGGDVVEIGAWKGRMTAWLVAAAERRPERPQVWSIDPHQNGSWEDFCQTVARFQLDKRGAHICRVSSRDLGAMWCRPISMLWIDGCHEYPAVSQDLAEFAPHVVVGGWVALDDSVGGTFPGVERAIAEWQAKAQNYSHVATVRNVSVFRRAA